ncbi:MAG: hypothetical protein WCF60_10620 [Anaerobacillus sp.]
MSIRKELKESVATASGFFLWMRVIEMYRHFERERERVISWIMIKNGGMSSSVTISVELNEYVVEYTSNVLTESKKKRKVKR